MQPGFASLLALAEVIHRNVEVMQLHCHLAKIIGAIATGAAIGPGTTYPATEAIEAAAPESVGVDVVDVVGSVSSLCCLK